MRPPANYKVTGTTEKRDRGRPRKPDAMSNAEREAVWWARHARMNAIPIHLLSLALFAAFCATLTYWIVTLTSLSGGPLPVAAGRAPVSVEQAATLFGGQLQRSANQDVRLFGILALRDGAAAIVSAGGEPPHAVSLGSTIMRGAKFFEVRPRSIIIDRNGARSEVFLPANAAGPTTYVR
ncbi:general secretion pathway protein C [Paraburkholderia sp. GAS348]